MSEISEECGIFGIAGHPRAAELTYIGLYALQHRGQESCGIAYCRPHGVIETFKGMGLVSDVFGPDAVKGMTGSYAIGHVRYSTSGESDISNAQPITVKMWQSQVSVAHNGNLVNALSLRKDLERSGSIFQTTSDTEVICHLLARESSSHVPRALRETLTKIRGAYSLVVLTPAQLIAARDPYGFRPLCLGRLGDSYVFSSETCGLDSVGAEFIRELDPGEIVSISPEGIEVLRLPPHPKQCLCAFEFIYFARPDSVIYGLNVHAARKALGKRLAQKGPCEADLVIGVPDSSLSAALGYGEESGIPYEMGLVKNRYVGRTFISPEQSMREFAVKLKLNPLTSLIKGKRVVLVDDSIVRGTTSRYIVGLLRSSGAKEVHVRISSPPYKFPCYYGIDTSSKGELIAASMSVEDIRKSIGADSLVYLDESDLREVLECSAGGLCYACFNGEYPAGKPESQS